MVPFCFCFLFFCFSVVVFLLEVWERNSFHSYSSLPHFSLCINQFCYGNKQHQYLNSLNNENLLLLLFFLQLGAYKVSAKLCPCCLPIPESRLNHNSIWDTLFSWQRKKNKRAAGRNSRYSLKLLLRHDTYHVHSYSLAKALLWPIPKSTGQSTHTFPTEGTVRQTCSNSQEIIILSHRRKINCFRIMDQPTIPFNSTQQREFLSMSTKKEFNMISFFLELLRNSGATFAKLFFRISQSLNMLTVKQF